MSILIKNGRVIDPANGIDEVSDILIEGSTIKEVGKSLSAAAAQIIDASGLVVMPGLVDMHVHLRDPGQEHKEDIVTGTRAAVCGGVTSVVCMPNTSPVVDNKTVVEYIINKAAREGYCNVFPAGTITRGLAGGELAPIAGLKAAGAVAISDDGMPVKNSNVMRRAMEYAKNFDMLMICHSEDLELVNGGVMNEGEISTRLGLRGNPTVAESIAVARDCALAEYTGARVHITHISCAESVEVIRAAKTRGVNVTADTAPHYFSLTDAAVLGWNTNAKMNPPLRTADDVAAIIEGLRDGTIDAIATDHAPHHIDEKNVEFDLAMNGIIGLETSLSLGLTHLVRTGKLTLPQLVEKMSANPSRILGINRGTLAVGAAADVAIVDIEAKRMVDVANFKSKSKNSPFDGAELFGEVRNTIVAGKIVV
ncbi:MAG: dihydroorotase [Oscillospiraceae bacterium]|nr:dihydroorotase [Oscillospiraceae bacterium]